MKLISLSRFFPLFVFLHADASPLSSSSAEQPAVSTVNPSTEKTRVPEQYSDDVAVSNDNYETMVRPNQEQQQTTTTHPTFTVQRLDAPIERIEIRLIDENTTKTEKLNTTAEKISTDSEVITASQPDIYPTTQEPNNAEVSSQKYEVRTSSDAHPPTVPSFSESDAMYKKAEYMVQATPPAQLSTSQYLSTSEPVPIAEDPSYFSTISSVKQESEAIQTKAWLSGSGSTTIPKFEGDIDEDDLPPPQSHEDGSEEKDPEEECLANKEQLSDEVVTRLKAETIHYNRLVRQRNEQQKEYCTGDAVNHNSDLYRRCSDWRSEKLVYYYKLMRKTYCQVENWPNPSKIKKTYGEYLNLFGTFYAFQK